jgi:hypothetical protein
MRDEDCRVEIGMRVMRDDDCRLLQRCKTMIAGGIENSGLGEWKRRRGEYACTASMTRGMLGGIQVGDCDISLRPTFG